MIIALAVAVMWCVTLPAILCAKREANKHRVPDWRFEPHGMLVWDYRPCPKRPTHCKSCGSKFEGENAYDVYMLYCWLLVLVTTLGLFVGVLA